MEEHLGWLSNLKKKQEGKSPLRAIHGRDPLGEYLQILDGRETYISLGLLAFPGDSWHELEIRDPHCSLGVYDFSICREDGGKFTCCGYAIELRELTPGRPDKQTQTEDLVGIPVLETRKVRFTSVSRVVRWFWKTHPGLSRTKVRVYDAVYDWVPAVKKAWRECVSQLDREGRLGPPLSQKLQVALLLQRLPDVREEKPAHPPGLCPARRRVRH